MFRCNHCHTEYGGIRGIAVDKCPRCKTRSRGANRPPAHLKASARRTSSLLGAR